MLLNLFLRHKPNTALPHRRRVIKHIEHPKPLPMFLRQLIQLRPKQDILGVDVRVDERELGAVEGVLEGGADDLEHGGYARPSCDHADFAAEGGVVLELAFRTFDADFVADLDEGEIS